MIRRHHPSRPGCFAFAWSWTVACVLLGGCALRGDGIPVPVWRDAGQGKPVPAADLDPQAAAPATALPGVGLPLPPLPEGWRAHWCPQLRPGEDYAPPAEALAAGWDWRRSCPQSGWSGWFAEDFQRTTAALRCAWEEDRWGTRLSHDGAYTLAEFEWAEVYWGRADPVFRSPCYLASDAGQLPTERTGGGEPPAPGTPIEVLIDGTWVRDEVLTAAGGRTVRTVRNARPGGRALLVADEGRTWRRVQAPAPPPPQPPPEPPPPPDPPPAECPPPPACRCEAQVSRAPGDVPGSLTLCVPAQEPPR